MKRRLFTPIALMSYMLLAIGGAGLFFWGAARFRGSTAGNEKLIAVYNSVSPVNDPTGPRVVDLKEIPDSTNWYPDFARGGRLLILTISTSAGSVRIVPLETPEESTLVGTFDGVIEGAINEDADGTKFLVFQSPIPIGKGMATTGSYQLWRVDRTLGQRRELKSPLGVMTRAVYPADRSLSPDGRYLVVKCLGSPDRAAQSLYVLDLTTEQFTPIRSPRPDLVFACWSQIHDASPCIVLSVEDPLAWDRFPRGRKYVADPGTGEVTDMPSPPLPTPDQLISPDGRLQLSVHPHEAIEVIDLASRQVRSFIFQEQDRKFIDDRMFKWLDSRYVEYGMFFIDISSMTRGDLPRVSTTAGLQAYEFSPDFKWAASRTNRGRILLGRVVVSPPAN